MGPLISARQRERVLGYIEKAKQEGARLVTGGGVADAPRRRATSSSRRSSPTSTRIDARAGGDLRPGARGHPVRGRRRRGADRERLDLRPLGRGHERQRGAGARGRARASAPARSRSTARCGSRSTRRSAATGRAASGARTASQGFEEYLETKVIGAAAALRTGGHGRGPAQIVMPTSAPRLHRAALRRRAAAARAHGRVRARPGRDDAARARGVRAGRRVPHAQQATSSSSAGRRRRRRSAARPDEQLSQKIAYRMMTPVFGEGVVFDAPPERLNEQLRILMPALRDRNMRTYADIFTAEVDGMVRGLGRARARSTCSTSPPSSRRTRRATACSARSSAAA